MLQPLLGGCTLSAWNMARKFMTKFFGIVDYPPTPPIVAAPKNLDTNGKNGKCSKFSEMEGKGGEQVFGMFDTGIQPHLKKK